jgi:hypothetical protein
MSSTLSPAATLRAYLAELEAAGISPGQTSVEQENRLQELVVEIWESEREA